MACSSSLASCTLPAPLKNKKEEKEKNLQTNIQLVTNCISSLLFFLNAIQRVDKEKESAKIHYPLFKKKKTIIRIVYGSPKIVKKNATENYPNKSQLPYP